MKRDERRKMISFVFRSDYEAIDELDRYETGGIDDDEENDVEMSVEQRRRAEREIKRRERERRRRLGQELNESDLDDEDEDDRPIGLSNKEKRSRMHDEDVGMDDDVKRNMFDVQIFICLQFSPMLISKI